MRVAHNYILINCLHVLPPISYASQRQPDIDKLTGHLKGLQIYILLNGLNNFEEEDDDEDEEQFFQESETLIPSTSSTANEVEEPICLVIEGETEALTSNDADVMHTVVSEEEKEFDDNSEDSDEDAEDEVEICDDHSEDE
ncbi:hypothetical protein L2E82_45175 [Cichorium intybus]|uniref:Uncharacterized protein n=1 Tax=Cichorium intybus TaxID=13427 RepID=A0ACB8ZSL0_CICIN|nr:hypothetical protein L2E82_45175 [Cichorium intybus]